MFSSFAQMVFFFSAAVESQNLLWDLSWFYMFDLLALNLSSIRVFSKELALCIRWPKYWSFSFSISPSNEYLGLIFFRFDWFDLIAVQGFWDFFSRNVLTILGSLNFYMNSRINLSISTKKLYPLGCLDQWCQVDIITILNLPIYEHNMSLHLFNSSSLISFNLVV